MRIACHDLLNTKYGVTEMDQVTNALAVIGIYFALMAVLSVSVEAVIGWFKIPIPWLQGKPSPSDVLNEVVGWLPADEEKAARARVVALNKALRAIGEVELKEDASIADIVAKIGQATTRYVQQERVRRAVIRVMAVVFGVGFAWLFQIDTLQLLAPLAEPAQALWQETLGGNGAHVVGLVLSGMAASAGSSFWHDQSARLRQLKAASEAVGELIGER
jgi:hypothetical protein